MFPAKGSLLIFGHRINNVVLNRCRKPANADILVPGDTICLIGTTSSRVGFDEVDDVRVTPEEVDLLLSEGEKLAPAARLGYTPDDFFETGHVYTNAVTVSGGTDKNQTYFSAASVNSDGIIPNNEYDRYNFTFRNTSYFLKDKLRLDASASYILSLIHI